MKSFKPKEFEVLRLLATRLSRREIGAQLYVSLNTVKTHQRAVHRKLRVEHRSAAVSRARDSACCNSPSGTPPDVAGHESSRLRTPRINHRDLPAALWLLGLRHLGQAYAWTIRMLPYANPEHVRSV